MVLYKADPLWVDQSKKDTILLVPVQSPRVSQGTMCIAGSSASYTMTRNDLGLISDLLRSDLILDLLRSDIEPT